MGASPSRLEQLETLVRALQGANAQLERQLLAVSKEADAGRRAELLVAIQAENSKVQKENEAFQRELTQEVRFTTHSGRTMASSLLRPRSSSSS
jgi:hypothetical protein